MVRSFVPDARRRFALRAALVLAVVAPALTARAALETQVYGIAKFGGSSRCGSSNQTHNVHTDTAAAFADKFQSLKADGRWDSITTMNNTAARGSYFTDASKSWCFCTACSCEADDSNSGQGADAADVIYVHTHGGHSTSGAGFSSLLMGNSTYACNVQTDSTMLWNDDLQIAVIKACQSGDLDVFRDGGYFSMVPTDSTFTMWNAFHGDSSCGNHVTNYVGDYADESVSNGVGENWIDRAYAWHAGSNNDDCPTSTVFGSSSSGREGMFERGGWRDRRDTGKKSAATMWFVSGCNPDNGSKLPD